MEYVTKKVPKRIVPLIRRLQAKRQLAEGRRVTEAEIIAQAVEALSKAPEAEKKVGSLKDFCGIIKGGPRTNAKMIDDIVYG